MCIFVVLSWDELKVQQNLPDSDYEIYMVHLLVATAERHKWLQFAKKSKITLLPCLTSNVEITCHYNLSLPTLIPINVKKKGRYFYSFQEMLGNLYKRTRVEVIKTPALRWAMLAGKDGQTWIVGTCLLKSHCSPWAELRNCLHTHICKSYNID